MHPGALTFTVFVSVTHPFPPDAVTSILEEGVRRHPGSGILGSGLSGYFPFSRRAAVFSTRDATVRAASPTATSADALVRRSTNSTIPPASFLPTVMRNGTPIRSASLNFTPVRSSRSGGSPPENRRPTGPAHRGATPVIKQAATVVGAISTKYTGIGSAMKLLPEVLYSQTIRYSRSRAREWLRTTFTSRTSC
jgi:hypothetical protein